MRDDIVSHMSRPILIDNDWVSNKKSAQLIVSFSLFRFDAVRVGNVNWLCVWLTAESDDDEVQSKARTRFSTVSTIK